MNEDGGERGGSPSSKPWERSWSTHEMRQNAHAWNLAGDAGLLKHLQEFSQTVLARTHTTEKALDSLVEEVNIVTSDVNTANNKFLCLANTQFVENRVYDDDDKETPQEEPVPDKKTKEETEARMLQKVREALSMSVAVLDTMFEPVEIQASDSDGESEIYKQGTKTLLLEPHNPYIHRPLPHLIGSEAFMSDDRIGLDDSPSDGEEPPLNENVDYDMEVSSESDIDFPPVSPNKKKRDISSSQSSVSDHVPQPDKSGQHPKKTKHVDPMQNIEHDSEEVLEQPTLSAQHKVQDSAFAAQLAAKLDKIASPATQSSSHTKTSSDNLFGGVPSDDEDDSLFVGGSSLFPGRPKLFDDLEDTSKSLWGPEPGSTYKNAPSEIGSTEPPSKAQHTKPSDSLFSDEEGDSLFSISAKTPSAHLKPDPHIRETGSQSSGTLKQQLTSGSHQSGIVTSTPESVSGDKSTGRVHGDERKTGLFYDVLDNQTNDLNGSASRKVGVGDPLVKEQPPVSAAAQKENLTSHEKKPAGGVPVFGQANILAGLKAKLPRRSSSSSSESSTSESQSISKADPASQSIFPSVDQAAHEGDSADKWNSYIPRHQHSQSTGIGYTPAATSTRLSNDDGHQTKNESNSTSIMPVASSKYNDMGYDDDDNDDIFAKKPSTIHSVYTQPTSGGLFADINDDDDDDLFVVSPSSKKEEKKPVDLPSERSVSSNLPKEDDSRVSATPNRETEKFPPINASMIAPTANISKYNAEKAYSHDIYSNVPPPLKSESKLKKPRSLFDDSDSGEDDLFSSTSSAGSRRSQASTDIWTASPASSIEKKPLSKKGLFDDDDALFGNTHNDPDIDIFGSSKVPTQSSTKLGSSQAPSQSLVKEDSDQKDNNTSVHISSTSSSGNANSALPIKIPKVNSKSVFKDDLFGTAGNEDDQNLFGTKSSVGLPGNGQLFATSGNNNLEDDLIQDASKSSSKLTDQIETEQPLSASNSGPNEQVNTDVPQVRSLKPSLVVEKESVVETEQKLPPPIEKESVKPISIKDEPSHITAVQQPRKPEPPRTLNIRKETDPRLGFLGASDDDDEDSALFSTPTVEVSSKPVPPPRQPVKPVVAVKTEAPKTLQTETGDQRVAKSSEKEVTEKQESDVSDVDGAAVSVSKLRSSLLAGGNGQAPLRIDPSALLPGQKPPQRRTPPKETIPALVASGNKDSPSVDTENPLGFDRPTQNSSTLPSANKDRAKLGVKRRPPSAKARREAARASQNFDQSDKESPLSPDSSSALTEPVGTLNTSVTSSNSILSPSTDEDDLFGVPQDLPSEYGNQIVTTADIFSGAPLLSPIAPENTSQSEIDKTVDSLEKNVTGKSAALKGNSSLFLPPDEKENSPSEELFTPFPHEAANEHKVITGNNVPAVPNLQETITRAADKGVPSKPVSSSAGASQQPHSLKGNTLDNSSSLLSSESEVEPSVTSTEVCAQDALKPTVAEVDSTQTLAGQNVISATPSIDPLNKVAEVTENSDDELFGTGNTVDKSEDHSALFPFVKKKPEIKQATKQPLFTKTPALPSKEDKSIAKPGLGGLDEVEDNDLFSTSKTNISSKIAEDVVANKLKGKEVKRWNFSGDVDDDDDDLFQSGARAAPFKSSIKADSSASASIQSAPVLSKTTLESTKPIVSEVDVKKMKPAQLGPKNGLFSDENDDDDDAGLFSKPSQFLRNKAKETLPVKSSLFDDDDDDLFGSNQGSSKKVPGQSMIKPKSAPGTTAQPSAALKLKKEDVFDDPLMALQNDN